MRFRKNQPFWTSVILHAVVLLFLFLSTIVEAFRPKEKDHVFVMVDTANAPIVKEASIPEPLPSLDLPDIQDLPDIPNPVVPAPAPEPPAPTQARQREMIPFDVFKEQHEIREPKPQKPRDNRNFQAPTITPPKNLDRLLQNQTNPQQAREMTAAQQTALQRYGAQLNARLNSAWRRPASLSGVQLGVTVVFDVSSSGRISNLRLKPSSGNSVFDQSVIAAFKSVASAGPTPTGQSHTFTMDFRLVE